MGKKPHPPRNGGANKKPATPVPDGDNIVFTNEKDKPKSNTNKQIDPSAKAGPSSGATDPKPPRPDARKVIGGASWTGKLPVNMLSEHCQKQKWAKPDYSMRNVPGGFQSAVTLSSKNPKTQEVITLPPFTLPPVKRDLSTEPTALEARHFAATWALFRISSMKNIHMMLPPKYRDLWKGEFEQIKQEDLAVGLAWRYEADPFAAKIEKDAAKVEAERKQVSRQKEKEEAAKASSMLPSSHGGQGRSKAWQHAMTVEMGLRLRSDIEEIVRRKAVWNPYHVTTSVQHQKDIIAELSALGFRPTHIKEALEHCKDREETLEWLLIYVPEDDLPPWAFPDGYSVGVIFASGNLAKEAALRRLATAGYPMDECEKAYKESNEQEALAAAILQSELLQTGGFDQQATESADSKNDQWNEEMTTLESIYAERFSSEGTSACTIGLELQRPTAVSLRIKLIQPPGSYPNVPPIVFIISSGLAAYIRLSATRKVIQWATETLLGEPMIFGIVDWLESNLSSVIERPGRLQDITLTSTAKDNRSTDNAPKAQPQGRGPIRRTFHGSKDHDADSRAMYEIWKHRQTTSQQQKMQKGRQALPAWSVRDAVLNAFNTSQVTIVSGETGSGKSTQSVQFVLDEMIQNNVGATANILCTQPRRISALGLADRVSNERCSTVGGEVGYIIRGDSKVSSKTKITFMTTGVLLRRLQSSDQSESLTNVSHIFVDEVHERSLDTDFLLALLRDVLKVNKHLKVVLMSATLDADSFVNYFGGLKSVGQVNIAGRTFPVKDIYLDDIVYMTNYQARPQADEDDDAQSLDTSMNELSIGKIIMNLGMGINYDLIAATVRYIDSELGAKDGAILIFLPGTMEIDRCLRSISNIMHMHALPLHASLTPSEQKLVFLPPPNGKRKVIAATNVAETSITIDDVVAVIDTGRVKETRYDTQQSVVRLEEVWASQAQCKQRRGRAGRVREGTCYKLYTRKLEQEMAARPKPEIRRLPLEQLCLSVKATDSSRDVAAFLRQTITPPEEGAVSTALKLLHQIGALEDGRLTALGRYLALIPADLRCAKLLVYSSIFGCLEACLSIAAILSTKSPFVSPRDKRDEAQEARASFSDGNGDLLLDLKAYEEWSVRAPAGRYRDTQAWCSSHFLSSQTLRDISSTRSQLLTSLKDAGLVPLKYSPLVTSSKPSTSYQFNHLISHNNTASLLRALIAAALTPQTARIDLPSKKFAASISGAVELDPEARTIRYFDHPQDNSTPTTTGPQTPNPSTDSPNPNHTSRLFIHPSSTLFAPSPTNPLPSSTTFLSYFTKLSTSKLFIRDLTPFNLYTLLLFGSSITVVPEEGGLLVDGGWIRVRGWARIGVLVGRLRWLVDDVLRRRFESGGTDVSDGDDARVVELVRRCVEYNGMDR